FISYQLIPQLIPQLHQPNKNKYLYKCITSEFYLMPNVSERQLLIQEIQHVVNDLEELSHDSRIAQWAGVSAGTVVNCTRRVMIGFLALHDSVIRWPSEDEKEKSKQWVEEVSCYAWRDGYCMVDGTPIVLFQTPGYHDKAYF